jgi:hypothetical protein
MVFLYFYGLYVPVRGGFHGFQVVFLSLYCTAGTVEYVPFRKYCAIFEIMKGIRLSRGAQKWYFY